MAEGGEVLDCGFVDEGDAHSALGYRIGGAIGILVASLIGFALPSIFSANRFNFMFFIFRTFAAGVVVAVAVVHIFPESIESLANPCLGWSDFPWGPMITLFAILLTFVFEHTLRIIMMDLLKSPGTASSDREAIADGSEEKGLSEEIEERVALQNYRVIGYTLEAGIIFHSIFVGISLGTSRDVAFVENLTFALVFHQGFEGIALGGALAKAKVSTLKLILLGAAFALTTPLGVGIGIAVSDSYNENDKVYLGFDGVVNSIAAGILVYNGLVDLILPAFMDDNEKPHTKLGTGLGFVSLLLGAGAMTLIAKWA